MKKIFSFFMFCLLTGSIYTSELSYDNDDYIRQFGLYGFKQNRSKSVDYLFKISQGELSEESRGEHDFFNSNEESDECAEYEDKLITLSGSRTKLSVLKIEYENFKNKETSVWKYYKQQEKQNKSRSSDCLFRLSESESDEDFNKKKVNFTDISYLQDEDKNLLNIYAQHVGVKLPNLSNKRVDLSSIVPLMGEVNEIALKDVDTLLHYAVFKENKNLIQLALDLGISVDFKNSKQEKPLDWAYEYTKVKSCKMLLEKGADGADLFFIICKKGNWNYANAKKCIEILLKHDKNIIYVQDTNGNHGIHFACENGNSSLELSQFLLDNDACVNAQNNDNDTPLHIACEAENKKLVKLLLENGANLNSFNIDGYTPLHVVCEEAGSKELASLLLQKGAHINDTTSYGCTPLHFACLNGNEELAALLLENAAEMDSLTTYNETPLHLAYSSENSAIIGLLLEKGANPNIQDSDGLTVLHHACAFEDIDIMELILLSEKVAIDTQDFEGFTGLHILSEAGSLEGVKLLLEHGASLDITTFEGKTALELAQKRGNEEIVALLQGFEL